MQVSLGFVCIGVMIASYSDVELNLLGTIVALSSVVITSFYQIVSLLYLFVCFPITGSCYLLIIIVIIGFCDAFHYVRLQ